MELLEPCFYPSSRRSPRRSCKGLFGAEVNASEFARKLARGDGRGAIGSHR
jgi:hypothetical protein